ncbi:family 43 glycosylhydrolase [Pelomyxa schiedti]|nr:family 43 glycosylhydrolase [Pelomyxa schiedti]
MFGSACAVVLVSVGVYVSCQTAGQFSNPVVDVDAPDPGVMYDGGYFWMVTTSGQSSPMFPIRKSTDLVSWDIVGYVFDSTSKPSWTVTDFWAPELHRVGDRIMVYFAARGSDGKLAVGGGWATSPEGPYTPLQYQLANHSWGAIDPTYFKDPQTSKQYLIWKVDGNSCGQPTPIMAQELNDAGDAVQGAQTELIDFGLAWEGSLVEAPWMMFHSGYYYLFYSGGAYNEPTYNVGVARSNGILGPYTKACAPVLSQYADPAPAIAFSGPGHVSVLDGIGPNGGAPFMIYHSWLRGDVGTSPGRVVLVDRMWWGSDGWPIVGSSGVPTSDPQPIPTTSYAVSRDPDIRLPANGTIYTLVTYEWSDHCWDDDGSITNCDYTYISHEGNCPGGTVSLESTASPGKYWRHQNGKLRLDYNDGTDLFQMDSSFMPLGGVHAISGVSLRSINYPKCYVRHQNGALLISEWDKSDLMAQDCTFYTEVN